MEIPASLRRWFLVHFVVDVAFGAPLLLAPGLFLSALGWAPIDPVAARLVGAALLAIGTQSLLGRDASVEVYRTMLRLKLVWSAGAIFGLVLGVGGGAPSLAWAILAVFIAFFGVWFHYYVRLKQLAAAKDDDLADDEDPADDEDQPNEDA